jgi:hypothetical protein
MFCHLYLFSKYIQNADLALFKFKVYLMMLNATFNNSSHYIVSVSFIAGGNLRTRR